MEGERLLNQGRSLEKKRRYMAIKTYFGSPHFYYGYLAGDTVEGIVIQQCTHDAPTWFNLTTKEFCETMLHARYLHNKGAEICQYCDECKAYIHPTRPKHWGEDDYDFCFGDIEYREPHPRRILNGCIPFTKEELQEKTMYAWLRGEID